MSFSSKESFFILFCLSAGLLLTLIPSIFVPHLFIFVRVSFTCMLLVRLSLLKAQLRLIEPVNQLDKNICIIFSPAETENILSSSCNWSSKDKKYSLWVLWECVMSCHLHLHSLHCDQMARLCFYIWPFTAMEPCSIQ